jgi:hypothetical protein
MRSAVFAVKLNQSTFVGLHDRLAETFRAGLVAPGVATSNSGVVATAVPSAWIQMTLAPAEKAGNAQHERTA